MRTIVFITGTRADYGKLKSLILKVQREKKFKCYLVITGMHILKKFSYTKVEIDKDKIKNCYKFSNQFNTNSMDIILANTIKGLNKFLKKECPEAFIDLPNSFFKGKRIAIDSNNVLYRFMSRAHKEIVNKTDVVVMEPNRDDIIKRWLYHVKNFLIELIQIGATPIFVFDGVYISEKSKTQEKRRADKQKMIDNAENLKIEILQIIES